MPHNPLRAIAIGWLTAFPPAAVLGMLVAIAMPEARTPEFPFTGALAMVMLVGFAPVAETLIMGTALLILMRLVSPTAAIFASTVGWAIFHSLDTAVWGLVIWWPFLVFSTLFVAWHRRSLLAAFAMPAIVHALNNFLPALPVAFPAYFGTA